MMMIIKSISDNKRSKVIPPNGVLTEMKKNR